MTAPDFTAADLTTHPYVRRMIGDAYPDAHVTLGWYPTCEQCWQPPEFERQVVVHHAECDRRRRDGEWQKYADVETRARMAKSLSRGPRPWEQRAIEQAEYGWAHDAELDSRRAAAVRGGA